jgi:hypothetical protein
MKTFITCILFSGITFLASGQITNQGEFKFKITAQLTDWVSMTIDLRKWSQLDSIRNVDSLLHKVWSDIRPIRDSLTDPYSGKRIDYSKFIPFSQFKVTEYPQTGNTYRYRNDSLIQFKTSRDTLKIRIYTGNPNYDKNKRGPQLLHEPYTITFSMNKLDDVMKLRKGYVDSLLATMPAIFRKDYIDHVNFNKHYYNNQDSAQSKWSISSGSWNNSKEVAFEPDLYFGLQYVRGNWVTSAALGFQLIHGNYFGKRKVYKIFWEPHFFFTTDNAKSTSMKRNDFITFRFVQYEQDFSSSNGHTNANDKVEFLPMSFSIGYLVGRSGNLYEKNTFKFSVPGFVFKDLNIEPEFFFNDLFKHFSPSLKLNLNLD